MYTYRPSSLQWHFPKLGAKARRSLLPHFSGKRPSSFGFELDFGLWKMSLQVGQAICITYVYVCMIHIFWGIATCSVCMGIRRGCYGRAICVYIHICICMHNICICIMHTFVYIHRVRVQMVVGSWESNKSVYIWYMRILYIYIYMYISVYIHIQIFVYIHILLRFRVIYSYILYIYIYIYVYIYIYICTRIHIHIYIHMHTQTYTHTHTRTHTHTHTRTYSTYAVDIYIPIHICIRREVDKPHRKRRLNHRREISVWLTRFGLSNRSSALTCWRRHWKRCSLKSRHGEARWRSKWRPPPLALRRRLHLQRRSRMQSVLTWSSRATQRRRRATSRVHFCVQHISEAGFSECFGGWCASRDVAHSICDMTHSICDMTHSICDMTHSICDMTHSICDMRWMTYSTRDMIHSVCDVTHSLCRTHWAHNKYICIYIYIYMYIYIYI